MRDVVLAVHIAAGVSGLVTGPLAPLTRGAARRGSALAYVGAVTTVAITACVLVTTAFDQFWWLLPVAVGTQAAVIGGWLAWRTRPPGWPAWCAHLLGGSYVALVTGTMLAVTGQPVFWVLPAVIAQWPIAVAKRRLAHGAEPSVTLLSGR